VKNSGFVALNFDARIIITRL